MGGVCSGLGVCSRLTNWKKMVVFIQGLYHYRVDLKQTLGEDLTYTQIILVCASCLDKVLINNEAMTIPMWAVVLISALTVRGHDIRGFDCTDPESSIVTVSTAGVLDCSAPPQKSDSELVYMQILKEQVSTLVEVKTCRVLKSSMITHCGMHSHASMLPKGFTIEVPEEITPSQCADIHEHRVYITPLGHRVTNVKGNATTHVKLTEIGMVNDEGKCKGQDFTVGDVTYSSAIMISHYQIRISSQVLRLDIPSRKMIIDSGERCNYDASSCLTNEGSLVIWEPRDLSSTCGPTTYIALYEGWGNLTKSKSAPMMLTVETNKNRFALVLADAVNVCGFHGYKSMKDSLVMIRGTPYGLPKHSSGVDIFNADIFTDIDIKFVYLEQNIINRTTDLYTLFTKRYCELNKKNLLQLLSTARTNPEEFAWLYMEGEPGYTALTRGEVIHIVKCTVKMVNLRITDTCFNELPVYYQNQTFFLKPANRILVPVGTPVPCTYLAPVLYHIHDKWVKMGGELVMAASPLKLSPESSEVWEYGEAVSMKSIGLLSESQVELYKKAILTPIERQAFSETFYGKVQDIRHPDGMRLNFNTALDADQIVDSVSYKVISKVYGFWEFAIRYLGAIFGLAILWDCLLGTLSIILNVILLYKKYGLSSVLFFALWSTGAKHILYGDLKSKRFPWNKRSSPKQDICVKAEMELDTLLVEKEATQSNPISTTTLVEDKPKGLNLYPFLPRTSLPSHV